MAVCCPQSIKGCAIRFTRESECYIALDPLTPNSRIQMAAFTSLSLSPDLEDGSDITVTNACGDVCIRDKDCDRLKGFDVTLTLCGVPLPALEMFLNATLLEDPTVTGDFRGAVLPESKSAGCPDPLSVEVWSRNADPAVCNPDGSQGAVYVQWLLPRVSNLQISGDITFENEALTLELSGYAENNPQWFPSFPDATFPSYDPGGGDPTGVPTGAPPPILPAGVTADPWTLADQAAIQAGGPMAWVCVSALPAPIDDCDYVPVAP